MAPTEDHEQKRQHRKTRRDEGGSNGHRDVVQITMQHGRNTTAHVLLEISRQRAEPV